MKQALQFYVNGAWVDPIGKETLEVINPATEEAYARIALGTKADVDRAVAAAKQAFTTFARSSRKERIQLLESVIAVYKKRYEEMAEAISDEMGAPLAFSRDAQAAAGLGHLSQVLEVLRTYEFDEVINNTLVTREPVGVCGFITPWNWPMNQIACKVGPALAAGCTMVLKPAQQTPLSALALAVLAEEAGVPPGVFHVITGSSREIGAALCESDVVRKLSFTGSTEVGRTLMEQCAPTIKKLSLELGGNAPFIVFDDADLDRAVDGILASKYRNAGQTCVCANRIYVQAGVYEEIARRLVEKVQAMKVGDGFADGVTQGPLIDANAVEKVQEHIADATAHGAKVIAGGKPHALGGTFFEPTVVRDVTQSMRFATEETFGPVAPLFRFETEEEVIRMANNTIFGLAAYFYTRDYARIWRVSEGLEYGIVGINTGIISNEVGPFGGVKQSGLGREGSKYGIEEYLEIKYLCVDLGG